MTIGIIGAGAFGLELAMRCGRFGVPTAVACRNLFKAKEKLEAFDYRVAPTLGDMASLLHASELLVLALPFEPTMRLAARYPAFAAGRTVIDATNPSWSASQMPTSEATLGAHPGGVIELVRLLPYVRLAKAFNTVVLERLHLDEADPIPIATDEPEIAASVAAFCELIALRPVHVGPLSMGRDLEGKALVDCLVRQGDQT